MAYKVETRILRHEEVKNIVYVYAKLKVMQYNGYTQRSLRYRYNLKKMTGYYQLEHSPGVFKKLQPSDVGKIFVEKLDEAVNSYMTFWDLKKGELI